jgi:8-oxo-dGTP pyrophosphatase MutT (NUDIX family)
MEHPDEIARALAAHRPRDGRSVLIRSRSAVAAVLRFDRGAAEVLLIQRAVHPGDRWSGHVSMPGGRSEPADANLLATAVRETREETGIELTAVRVLGRGSATWALAKGKLLPMTVTPFVFHLAEVPPIVLSDHFWFPIGRAARGELDGRFDHQLGPLPLELPCWRWEGRTVWGLTYTMLYDVVSVVQRARIRER